MRAFSRQTLRALFLAIFLFSVVSVISLVRHQLVYEQRLAFASGAERFYLVTGQHIKEQPPKLIPRIIHQTYKSQKLETRHLRTTETWRLNNPAWTYKFYDDSDCQDFVAQEFPQWFDAYVSLPLAVERADFFRYMVVLRYGGVYADVDTECGSPLDNIILPDDTFLAGWEDEYATADAALDYKFSRQRQLLQWVFAATPGHPALLELCEQVAANAILPIADKTTDALFRTGPGPFTDVVVKHAMRQPVDLAEAPKMRLLPRVVLGGLPGGGNYLKVWEEPSRVVAHLHMGSWKISSFKRKEMSKLARQRAIIRIHGPTKGEAGRTLYPVSVPYRPPFTVMTHLKGQGDCQGMVGVETQITTWGAPLVPGEYITRHSPMEIFMDAWLGNSAAGQVLVDIGAGIGFYSLAAAAAGRSVEAFETGPKNLVALRAGVISNNFSDVINVRSSTEAMRRQDCIKSPFSGGDVCNNPFNRGRQSLAYWKEMAPGLGSIDVGAVRIATFGWEGWIIDALKAILRKPSVQIVMLELYPHLLAQSGYKLGAANVLEELNDLGFSNVQHVGLACMRMRSKEAWKQMPISSLLSLWSSWKQRLIEQHLAGQPDFKWCSYREEEFRAATDHVSMLASELFILQRVEYQGHEHELGL